MSGIDAATVLPQAWPTPLINHSLCPARAQCGPHMPLSMTVGSQHRPHRAKLKAELSPHFLEGALPRGAPWSRP